MAGKSFGGKKAAPFSASKAGRKQSSAKTAKGTARKRPAK